MTEEMKMKDYKNKLGKVQSWSKEYASAAEIPDEKIPLEYDFRNLDGLNLLTAPRDQGACGSCFT